MPGWFVTGTDTGVGKTVIAGALAHLVRMAGRRAGVYKPVATGCRHDPRLGLVCPDAEFLSHCAEAPQTLEVINPIRYASELAPMVAARREHRPVDRAAIEAGYERIRGQSDWMIVEGAGGLLVPIENGFDMADLAGRFGLPLVIVARPDLGTINHTLLTVEAARRRKLAIAAIVIDGYRPASGTLAEETNPDVIGELTGMSIPLIVPHDPQVDMTKGRLTESILFPLRDFVEASLAGRWRGDKGGGRVRR